MPGPPHHARRGGRIPLPLPTGMQVRVDVTVHHGHRLRACRPDPHELDVHLVAQPPQHRGRTTGAGGDPDRAITPRRRRGDGVGAIHLPEGGQCDRRVGDATVRSAPVRCHSAMCTAQSLRPVENSHVPSSGSTIHTRSACTRDRSSTASSDSTESAGRSRARPSRIRRVGPLVPFVAEVVRVPEAVALAHPEQQFTGLAGQLGGQRGIGETHHSSIAE